MVAWRRRKSSFSQHKISSTYRLFALYAWQGGESDSLAKSRTGLTKCRTTAYLVNFAYQVRLTDFRESSNKSNWKICLNSSFAMDDDIFLSSIQTSWSVFPGDFRVSGFKISSSHLLKDVRLLLVFTEKWFSSLYFRPFLAMSFGQMIKLPEPSEPFFGLVWFFVKSRRDWLWLAR